MMYAVFEYDRCVFCVDANSAQHAEQLYRDQFNVHGDAPIFIQEAFPKCPLCEKGRLKPHSRNLEKCDCCGMVAHSIKSARA